MERDFSIVSNENDSRKSFLPQGFLSCVVTKLSDPQQTRRFIYCLHCTKLKSLAWFYRHKKKYNVVPSPEEVRYFKTNLFHYQQDIGTELDLLYDNRKLFVQQHEESSHVFQAPKAVLRPFKVVVFLKNHQSVHRGLVAMISTMEANQKKMNMKMTRPSTSKGL